MEEVPREYEKLDWKVDFTASAGSAAAEGEFVLLLWVEVLYVNDLGFFFEIFEGLEEIDGNCVTDRSISIV